ncbi:hypothetical protein FVE85_7469 [Porphyridium purpureum]|uniref:Uncharacterized protein n=1 Tax=Porphyridium purpureum TaxID=35688 RepID=A0A5J4ZA48_PORPP|nr:hypothetical protein FVE85_7469 [Porphyridium purpureum]|eukprot:POR2812..scf295_1
MYVYPHATACGCRARAFPLFYKAGVCTDTKGFGSKARLGIKVSRANACSSEDETWPGFADKRTVPELREQATFDTQRQQPGSMEGAQVEPLRAEIAELEELLSQASAKGYPAFYADGLEQDLNFKRAALNEALGALQAQDNPNVPGNQTSLHRHDSNEQYQSFTSLPALDSPKGAPQTKEIAGMEQIRASIAQLQAVLATPGMPAGVIQSSQVELYRLHQVLLAHGAPAQAVPPERDAVAQVEDPEIAVLEAQLASPELPASVRAVIQKCIDSKRLTGAVPSLPSPPGSDAGTSASNLPQGQFQPTPSNGSEGLYGRGMDTHPTFYAAPGVTAAQPGRKAGFASPPGSDAGVSVSGSLGNAERYPSRGGFPGGQSASNVSIDVHKLQHSRSLHGSMYHQPQTETVAYSTMPQLMMPSVSAQDIALRLHVSKDAPSEAPGRSVESVPELTTSEKRLNGKKAEYVSNTQDLRIASLQFKQRELETYAADRERRLDRYQQNLDMALVRERDSKQVYRALIDSEEEDLETRKRKEAAIEQATKDRTALNTEIYKLGNDVKNLQQEIEAKKAVQEGKLLGKKKFLKWVAEAEEWVSGANSKISQHQYELQLKQEEIDKLVCEIGVLRDKHSDANHRRAKTRYEEELREVRELEDRIDKLQQGNKNMLDAQLPL